MYSPLPFSNINAKLQTKIPFQVFPNLVIIELSVLNIAVMIFNIRKQRYYDSDDS